MRKFSITLCLISSFTLLGTQLAAQSQVDFFKTDSDAPIRITADYFNLDHKTGVVEFSKNMRLEQGPFTITADKLAGSFPASVSSGTRDDAQRIVGDITVFRASGNVEIMSANGRKASGQWASYDLATQQLTMGDKVVLLTPSVVADEGNPETGKTTPKTTNKLQSGGLLVDMRTGIGQMKSSVEGGRVRGVFTPGSRVPD